MSSRTCQMITELQQRYTDGVTLLTRFNPSMQVQFCRDKDKCHFGNAPTIRLVERAYGRETALSWLEIQLRDLSEFAGCKEKLAPAQIAETAAMMLNEYPAYKLTEFMLFFQRFKSCEYGKFYGAVDPMVILQALLTFDGQRSRAFHERAQKERNAKKAEQEAEYEELRRRYERRIADAWTEAAQISFLQYRLMGYDLMSDEQLADEMKALRSGAKKIPRQVAEILDFIKAKFGIEE